MCPRCSSRDNRRHSSLERKYYDIQGKKIILIKKIIGKYYCKNCQKHFVEPLRDVPKGSKYSYNIRKLAIKMRKDNYTYCAIRAYFKTMDLKVNVSTINDWLTYGK